MQIKNLSFSVFLGCSTLLFGSNPKKTVSFEEPLVTNNIESPAFSGVRAGAGAATVAEELALDHQVYIDHSPRSALEEISIKAQADPFYGALLAGLQGVRKVKLLPIIPEDAAGEVCFSDDESESESETEKIGGKLKKK